MMLSAGDRFKLRTPLWVVIRYLRECGSGVSMPPAQFLTSQLSAGMGHEMQALDVCSPVSGEVLSHDHVPFL